MNSKQRAKNRKNARILKLHSHVCEECGERGGHWVGVPQSIESMMLGLPSEGFYTCAKFYDASGRRIES